MTAPIILADLADLCRELSERMNDLGLEAYEALRDRDLERVRLLSGKSAGIQEAVTAVLAFIAARVEKETT